MIQMEVRKKEKLTGIKYYRRQKIYEEKIFTEDEKMCALIIHKMTTPKASPCNQNVTQDE